MMNSSIRYIVYCTGPILLLCGSIIFWQNRDFLNFLTVYIIFYLGVLLLGIWKAYNQNNHQVISFAVLAIFILANVATILLHHRVEVTSFNLLVYPMKDYITNKCRPIRFNQNGNPYDVGLCNWEKFNTGEFDYLIVYDTSGDVTDDLAKKSATRTRDSPDWVRAVRKFIEKHPLPKREESQFEVSNFFTTPISGSFYLVKFDDTDKRGFTSEYGPPGRN